ncbi:MAG TPA: CpsD/CapB family tyrosine-protein kinase, partial [Acidimicrobiia bacterium]|nr:CpsD/CapB family tyrosine-protein kinase [Acidimicrobiia bacterium]
PPATYKATNVLAAKPLTTSVSTTIDYDRLALIATSGDVPARAAATLGFGAPTPFTPPNPDPKEPAPDPNKQGTPRGVKMSPVSIVVTPNAITGSLTMTATAHSRYQAAAAANALSTELLIFVNLPSSNAFVPPLLSYVQHQIAAVDAQRKPILDQLPVLNTALINSFLSGSRDAFFIGQRIDTLVGRLIPLDRQLLGLVQQHNTTSLVTLTYANPNSEDVIPPRLSKQVVVKSGWPRYLLGAGIGLAVGIALVLLAETMRPRIRDLRSAEGTARMPVAAEISSVSIGRADRFRVIAAEEPSSLLAEAYRTLRTSIIAMWPRHPVNTNGSANGAGHVAPPLRTLLVTSAGPGEGKSVTAVNLAATFAETGARVIVLDADPRRPTVHRYFGGRSTPNLAELGVDLTAADLEHVLQDSNVRGVRFAASARGTVPAQTVGVVKAATRAATELADIVILDAPPLLVANDAADLATVTDATIFVVRANRTRRDTVARAAGLLRRVEARVVGAVLIGVERTTPDGFYGYYGYYGYSDASARPRRRLFGGLRRTRRARRHEAAVRSADAHARQEPVAVIDLTHAHRDTGAAESRGPGHVGGTIVTGPSSPTPAAPATGDEPDAPGPSADPPTS